MLSKSFVPHDAETRIYADWEKDGVFTAGSKPDVPSYSIVIPPPNVTGSLHMGHALNNTLQDIMVRYKRMRGFNVLWQPGTDHAGIATQMLVERKLEAEGQPDRRTLGREKFIERVWEWKEESGGTITTQLRRLGASCDWSRERFTMDAGLSEAVLEVFVALYRDGLIYKDKRLVNWDTKLQTAISDLEVQQVEKNGHLWHLRYPVEGEQGRFIVVATTRPETMLGDMAVAVHPTDTRYQDIIGKFVRLPITNRLIPILADEHADPETGSGAVKITPAHDFNDFEVGKRHHLEMLSILDEQGFLNENTPSDWRGLERFEARKKVVDWFKAHDLLEKIEDHVHVVPHGDRSGTIIEPLLTDQWYCDAPTLAEHALKVVADGETKFIPTNWTKTYNDWLNNIEPWCISRQLWWGHQIPAWYGPDGEVFVAKNEDEAHQMASAFYHKDVSLMRDEDVLDTWFSSALWPFSTLGWPEKTDMLERYYPTALLVTGFDIIFFWVARMMMFGLYFLKDEKQKPLVPFRDVYIHALVRDEHGQKMSKSKGNVIDPLELIDEFGADALRFTLAAMAAQGRDVKLAKTRVEGYRNFTTKIWNAVRFAEMNEATYTPDFDVKSVKLEVNQWILASLDVMIADIDKSLDDYRFNDAAQALYRFAWNQLCDWYVEMVKPFLQGSCEASKAEIRSVLGMVINQTLHCAHPFIPFITEEIFQQSSIFSHPDKNWLANSSWPELGLYGFEGSKTQVERVIAAIELVRSTRVELGIKPSAQIPATIEVQDKSLDYSGLWPVLSRLARIDIQSAKEQLDTRALALVGDGMTIYLRVENFLDFSEEVMKLSKEINDIEEKINSLKKKLANASFVEKAPQDVVSAERQRLIDLTQRNNELMDARQRMEDLSARQ